MSGTAPKKNLPNMEIGEAPAAEKRTQMLAAAFALALAATRAEEYQGVFIESSKTGFDIRANARALDDAFNLPKGQPTKAAPWRPFAESVCGPNHVCCVCAGGAAACLSSCDGRTLVQGKPWCRPCAADDIDVDPSTLAMPRRCEKTRRPGGILSSTCS